MGHIHHHEEKWRLLCPSRATHGQHATQKSDCVPDTTLATLSPNPKCKNPPEHSRALPCRGFVFGAQVGAPARSAGALVPLPGAATAVEVGQLQLFISADPRMPSAGCYGSQDLLYS